MNNKRFLTASLIAASLLPQSLWAQGGITDMISNQIADQVSRTTSNAISRNLNESIFIPQLKIKNASGPINAFSISKDGRLLGILHNDGTVRLWDTQVGVQRPALLIPNANQVAVLSKADIAIVGGKDGSLVIHDVITGKPQRQLNTAGSAVTAMVVSDDEQRLWVAHGNGSIDEWDMQTLTAVKTVDSGIKNRIDTLLPLSGGQLAIAGENGFVERWDFNAGSKIASLSEEEDNVIGLWLNASNNQLLAADQQGRIQAFNLANNQSAWSKQPVDADTKGIAVDTRQGLAVLQGEENKLVIFDLNTQKIRQTITATEPLGQLQFIADNRLAGADGQGILHVYDTRGAIEVLKLISTNSGWTVVDNQGRFDSSEKGMANVSWLASDKDIPIDNFSQNYYEPGLLSGHLQNRPFINSQPKTVQAGINLPPEIKFIDNAGSANPGQPYILTVETQDLAGGIASVRLYHNGKIVLDNQQLDSQKSEVNGLEKRQTRFQVTPTPGDNRFKAVASNRMGIDNTTDEIHVNAIGTSEPSTLHVLTVGINNYKDSNLNLAYSIPDAESIAKLLGSKQLINANDIKVTQLIDQKATRQAILDQLKKMASYPQQDQLAIYLAGHGIAVSGDWYFMPYETTLQLNDAAYASIGVSAKEMRELIAGTKIQKIVVLIDSCYSGAGLDAFRGMQNSQRHFGRNLSKSSGVVVLAATRQDQQAAELKSLGHGLFTYVVTQGLQGQADLKPVDTNVSAHEVADYSLESIPSFSKKYLRAAQEPTAFTLGQDFNLLRTR